MLIVTKDDFPIMKCNLESLTALNYLPKWDILLKEGIQQINKEVDIVNDVFINNDLYFDVKDVEVTTRVFSNLSEETAVFYVRGNLNNVPIDFKYPITKRNSDDNLLVGTTWVSFEDGLVEHLNLLADKFITFVVVMLNKNTLNKYLQRKKPDYCNSYLVQLTSNGYLEPIQMLTDKLITWNVTEQFLLKGDFEDLFKLTSEDLYGFTSVVDYLAKANHTWVSQGFRVPLNNSEFKRLSAWVKRVAQPLTTNKPQRAEFLYDKDMKAKEITLFKKVKSENAVEYVETLRFNYDTLEVFEITKSDKRSYQRVSDGLKEVS